MFQWVETTPYVSIGHGEEFESTYSTEWRWEVVNSEDFKEKNGHQNPSAMSVESFTAVASDVHVGSYYLSKGLIEKIDNFKQLILIQNGKPHADVITQGDYFYHSASPSNPEVGDLRITFWYAGGSLGDLFHLEDTVSVVARQRGVELVPYETKAGDQLELLYMGNHTAEEMFHAEHRSNTLKTWMLRGAGWAAIFLAIGLVMNSHTLVDWFPILQNLVSLDFFAVCSSSSLSLMIIAARWFFYRPLLSGIQAVAAVGILFLARSRVPRPIPCSSPKKFQ